MSFDNCNIVTTGQGIESLKALLAYWSLEHKFVEGWSEVDLPMHDSWMDDNRNISTLVFSWSSQNCQNKLPSKTKTENIADLVIGWLESGEYPKEPDQDGSNRKGWYAFTDFWGHVGEDRYAVIGFQRCWVMYGK